jgi:hypothetical protein
MNAQEQGQYLRGYEAGAAVIRSHGELGMPGAGVTIVQGMALELAQGGVGLAVAQGLADAALVEQGK